MTAEPQADIRAKNAKTLKRLLLIAFGLATFAAVYIAIYAELWKDS